ncbi:uncharacterized protein METZ01_LOCUS134855 [marine metagenome]|uniref:Uncharacterized protein n=1 Tax=marine metagenome TaxID=408172 RepID=A0A381YZC5_9ZZZZ
MFEEQTKNGIAPHTIMSKKLPNSHTILGNSLPNIRLYHFFDLMMSQINICSGPKY